MVLFYTSPKKREEELDEKIIVMYIYILIEMEKLLRMTNID